MTLAHIAQCFPQRNNCRCPPHPFKSPSKAPQHMSPKDLSPLSDLLFDMNFLSPFYAICLCPPPSSETVGFAWACLRERKREKDPLQIVPSNISAPFLPF